MIISTVVTGADYLVSVMSLTVNDKDPRLMPDLIVAQLLPRMRMTRSLPEGWLDI